MRSYGLLAAALLIALQAVLAGPPAARAAGPKPQPARDAKGKVIPNVFRLILRVGDSSTFTLGPNLSKVTAGPLDLPQPGNALSCTSTAITGGGGDPDVSDTITITAVRPGTSLVLMVVKEWRLNFINTPGQHKPGNIGHWVEGTVVIFVTCVEPPPVPTRDPGQPPPGNPGNPPGNPGTPGNPSNPGKPPPPRHPQRFIAGDGGDLFDAVDAQPLTAADLLAGDGTDAPVGLSPDQAVCAYPETATSPVYDPAIVELVRRLFGDVRGLTPALVDLPGPGGTRVRLCDLSGDGRAKTLLIDRNDDGPSVLYVRRATDGPRLTR
jgi:hypothetical protein